MGRFTQPVENLTQEASDYVDLKIDQLKLTTVKGLSMTLSKLLYLLLLLLVVSIIMISVAVGGILWIGELVGSHALGALIVIGFFLLVLLALYLLRDKLFKNTFVPILTKIFFEDE